MKKNILTSQYFQSNETPELNLLYISFLTEKYDKNDLIFFLFVRSIIEKELGIQIYSCNFFLISNFRHNKKKC